MAGLDKVECKCCGMMMVPKPVFSRGLYGGWGLRFGAGTPTSNCCPFCLSESWDGSTPDPRTKTWYKLLAVVLTFLCFVVVVAILGFVNDRLFGGELPKMFGILPIACSLSFAWWFTRIS